jgi:hypothetical protein
MPKQKCPFCPYDKAKSQKGLSFHVDRKHPEHSEDFRQTMTKGKEVNRNEESAFSFGLVCGQIAAQVQQYADALGVPATTLARRVEVVLRSATRRKVLGTPHHLS